MAFAEDTSILTSPPRWWPQVGAVNDILFLAMVSELSCHAQRIPDVIDRLDLVNDLDGCSVSRGRPPSLEFVVCVDDDVKRMYVRLDS